MAKETDNNLIKEPNRFELSVASAKRARQIKEGATPLVEITPKLTSHLMIALEEIKQGKINVLTHSNTVDGDPSINELDSFIEDNETKLENDELEKKKEEEENSSKKDKKPKKDKKKTKSLSA